MKLSGKAALKRVGKLTFGVSGTVRAVGCDLRLNTAKPLSLPLSLYTSATAVAFFFYPSPAEPPPPSSSFGLRFRPCLFNAKLLSS